MRWEKLGQIFDPRHHVLAGGCSLFAKSPQGVEYDDFVRVFFSAQRTSENGKFLACPQYADYTKDFSRLLRVSSKPIIALGGLGHFDEHGIFPFSPLRQGTRVLAYTTGWSRRVSVSVDMGIGLAVSDDGGETFVRHGAGGPILCATHDEPMMVGDAFVRLFEGRFHMWYIFGDRWLLPPGEGVPERCYRIASAVSDDGITWQREGRYLIETRLENECQALPTVFFRDGLYHMYFCFRDVFGFRQQRSRSYRLGYATSSDLRVWERKDGESGIELAASGWDSEMMCYPNVFDCAGETYLLYNGNEFGKYGFGLARLVC